MLTQDAVILHRNLEPKRSESKGSRRPGTSAGPQTPIWFRSQYRLSARAILNYVVAERICKQFRRLRIESMTDEEPGLGRADTVFECEEIVPDLRIVDNDGRGIKFRHRRLMGLASMVWILGKRQNGLVAARTPAET